MQLKALEIEKLRLQIPKLRRMQFGRSSERITDQIGRLELRLEELETGEAEDFAGTNDDEPAGPIPPRTRPKRKPLPDHLPRHETTGQRQGWAELPRPASRTVILNMMAQFAPNIPAYFRAGRSRIRADHTSHAGPSPSVHPPAATPHAPHFRESYPTIRYW